MDTRRRSAVQEGCAQTVTTAPKRRRYNEYDRIDVNGAILYYPCKSTAVTTQEMRRSAYSIWIKHQCAFNRRVFSQTRIPKHLMVALFNVTPAVRGSIDSLHNGSFDVTRAFDDFVQRIQAHVVATPDSRDTVDATTVAKEFVLNYYDQHVDAVAAYPSKYTEGGTIDRMKVRARMDAFQAKHGDNVDPYFSMLRSAFSIVDSSTPLSSPTSSPSASSLSSASSSSHAVASPSASAAAAAPGSPASTASNSSNSSLASTSNGASHLTWFEEWSIQHCDHLNTLTYAGGKWKDVFAKKAAPKSYRHETFLFRAEDLIDFLETCKKMCPKVSFHAKQEWYSSEMLQLSPLHRAAQSYVTFEPQNADDDVDTFFMYIVANPIPFVDDSKENRCVTKFGFSKWGTEGRLLADEVNNASSFPCGRAVLEIRARMTPEMMLDCYDTYRGTADIHPSRPYRARTVLPPQRKDILRRLASAV